ncbi:MAG: hypothetical protein ACIAXF_12150 [Phycisphaerales bacterium JB063]
MDLRARLLVTTLFAACLAFAGCHESVHDPKTYDREAQYLGLNEHSVAVIIAMSDQTQYQYPDARRQLAREITRRIAVKVPGVEVVDPDVLIQWQGANPYWNARPPSRLIEALNVDRVVVVEIGEYRMTDPGDTNIKRGVISGNVNVIEADAADPDNYGFTQTIRLSFPDEFRTRVGMPSASVDDIRIITVSRFTEDVAGLFYDHSVIR